MYRDVKTMTKFINIRIKESEKSDYTVKDTQKRDVLLALLDYLLDRAIGYRDIAAKHGMSKSKFGNIIQCMPAKFNKKLAQKIYKKVLYNQVQDYNTKVLTDKEIKSLENAYAKLTKKSCKTFNNMSAKDIDKLLWHNT